MLWLRTEDARPGMTLAATLAHPTGESDLVKAGVKLDANLIARLHELSVPWLSIAFEPLSTLDRHLGLCDSEPALALRRLSRELYGRSTADPHRELPLGQVYGVIRELLLQVASLAGRGLYYELQPRDADDLPGHAAEVATLSLLLGSRLERYVIKQRHRLPPQHARELINLGVGALLHDIGKTRQDATLRKFHVARPPGDTAARGEWQSHTRLGYELVKDGVEASAATAVLHHHQHMDGSGFPRLVVNGKRLPCAGTRLHVFARIVAVANTYNRLTWDPSTGTRLTPLEALAKVRALATGRLDGVVVKALHEVCPPFPPGSTVTLDDGTSAVVVQVNEQDVFRPIVRRLGQPSDDEALPVLADEAIDLHSDRSRRIVRVGTLDTAGLTLEPSALEAIGQWPGDDDALAPPAVTGDDATVKADELGTAA